MGLKKKLRSFKAVTKLSDNTQDMDPVDMLMYAKAITIVEELGKDHTKIFARHSSLLKQEAHEQKLEQDRLDREQQRQFRQAMEDLKVGAIQEANKAQAKRMSQPSQQSQPKPSAQPAQPQPTPAVVTTP